MRKVDIAGLQVDAITKQEFIDQLAHRLAGKIKTFVITPYSEFLYAALRNRRVMELLNSSDIAIPDGIGVLWAQRFLALPFSVEDYYLKIIQSLWQMVYSGTGILLRPKWLYRVFPEKLTGADIVWDIAQLAAQNDYSVYLLGGFGDTAKIAAQKLQQRYPNLKIAGTSSKHPDDVSIINDITQAHPGILMVAYGPIRQEQWIKDHYNQLPAKMMIGLGGTFDYLAGKKLNPPKFIRRIGLEWLYRLITQPRRFKRIMQATFGLMLALLRYKVLDSMPLRDNVVCVVINRDNKVLIAKRAQTWYILREIALSRIDAEDYWQFPQGGIEKAEQLIASAQRELKEETNISSVKAVGVSKETHTYTWVNGSRPLLGQPMHNRGQKQQIVYFRFTGDNQEITIDDKEFSAYQWVRLDQLRTILHQERQPLVGIVLSDINEHKILETGGRL